MDMSVNACATRGAARLDEDYPGWERRIDPATLELENPNACVLCQVTGDYFVTARRIARRRPLAESPFSTMGFNRPPGATWNYQDLDAAWLSLVKERFDSGTLSDEA